jgi:hypothetical protein
MVCKKLHCLALGLAASSLALLGIANPTQAATFGGVEYGNLLDYLFFFADGNKDANWQGASKGFVGDVAVDGFQAKERTSGTFGYEGTIFTNDATLGKWGDIVDNNSGATASLNQTTLISGLESDLDNVFTQINGLTATTGFDNRSSTSLDGLNTQNNIAETIVINVTSGLNFSDQIKITGDANDIFILRWDEDGDFSNGYNGEVKPQSGGAIVPLGGLSAANFFHVAGNLNASGGGSTPTDNNYLQGTPFDDFDGGGFFTGYWFTTGDPDKNFENSSLSNGIFVGGWYTTATKFSLTSGTSGVHVAPLSAVPEPLTFLGVGVAVGFGVVFKKQLRQKNLI